jgi:RNA polymerase sigma-70 factor (ECF subfamily)
VTDVEPLEQDDALPGWESLAGPPVSGPAADAPRTRVTLLRRLRSQQDERSWCEFVGYYRGYILRIARRVGLGHHDTEEVAQNVCLKAWKALPQFAYDPERGRFRNWLWEMTANEARTLWRARQRKTPLPEALGEAGGSRAGPGGAWIEHEWRCHVAGEAWRRVAPEFEERTRRVFELLSRGRDAAAVAAELGLSVSSVYVYRKRVQDRLRREVMRLNALLD